MTDFWWDVTDRVHEAVWDMASTLYSDAKDVRENMRKLLERYLNRTVPGLAASEYYKQEPDESSTNICASVVDTAAAKIAAKKTRVQFLTSGGTYSAQRKALRCSSFALGLHAEVKLHKLNRQVFSDGAIFGRGFLRPGNTGGKEARVTAQRVLPWQILVDQKEALEGEEALTHLYHVCERSKDALCERYPEHELAIKGGALLRDTTTVPDGNSDSVTLVEAWHLPSGAEAKDGRRVLCLSTVVLEDEPYNEDHFPFATFCWNEPKVGYWPPSLVEQVSNSQDDIDALEGKERAQSEMGAFVLLVNGDSEIDAKAIDNTDGQILRYRGQPPIFESPNPVSPEIPGMTQRKVQGAYDISGISRLSAQAQKPSGIDSKVALREMQDIESERFSYVVQQYDEYVVRATELLFAEVQKCGEGYMVLANTGRGGEQISFDDVKLPEGKYVIQAYPSNMLPTEPAGRLQRVSELMEAGFIGKEEAFALLEMPDLDAANRRINAPWNEVDHAIELMLDRGEPVKPTQYTDLGIAGRMVHLAYLEALLSGEEEARLELLRSYLTACEELQKQQQPTPVATPSDKTIQSYQPPPQGAPQPQQQPAPLAPPQGVIR